MCFTQEEDKNRAGSSYDSVTTIVGKNNRISPENGGGTGPKSHSSTSLSYHSAPSSMASHLDDQGGTLIGSNSQISDHGPHNISGPSTSTPSNSPFPPTESPPASPIVFYAPRPSSEDSSGEKEGKRRGRTLEQNEGDDQFDTSYEGIHRKVNTVDSSDDEGEGKEQNVSEKVLFEI